MHSVMPVCPIVQAPRAQDLAPVYCDIIPWCRCRVPPDN